MIVCMTKDDRPLLLLGLSRTNVELMMDGMPIFKDDPQLPFVLCIVGGETEDDITKQLQDEFDIPGHVIQDRRDRTKH